MAQLKRETQAAWMAADLQRWQMLSTRRTALDVFKGCPRFTEEEFSEFEKALDRSQWGTASREVNLGDCKDDDPDEETL